MDNSNEQWIEQVISIDRVARVVKGGRRFRFRALVAVGDGKRQVGIGVSKGDDVQTAITKAIGVAKRQMIKVNIKNGTIPHEITVKHGGAKVMLKPAAPGTGVIAGGVVRSVIDATGIANVLSKTLGSNSKINNAYATIKALDSLVPAKDWINSKTEKKTASKKPAISKKAKV
ncbi:MAG TPA: 30S ribosomal protein S5 [Candidatus Saccharimonadales bacterium]